jgi:hypothetical protein
MGETRPTIDYETPPAVKHRPSFLEKLNPNATPRSILFKAIQGSAVMVAIFAFLKYKTGQSPSWLALVGCMAIGAFAGIVLEWQQSGK